MRVVGIDPGTHRTGWGIVDSEGSRLLHIASGTVSGGDASLPERLRAIADALDEIIRRYTPEAAAIEALFHAKNSQSALKLGHARGVAIVCVARAGVPLFEYAPAVIKRAATGSGRAAKEQVQRMVQMLLGHQQPMGLDASDALAAAICHIHATPGRLAMEAAEGAALARWGKA